jgi:hypothetical protein
VSPATGLRHGAAVFVTHDDAARTVVCDQSPSKARFRAADVQSPVMSNVIIFTAFQADIRLESATGFSA